MQILKKDRSSLIAAAMKKIPCDLTINNVQIVNVFTGEVYPGSVDILDGIIVHVNTDKNDVSLSKRHYDGKGCYLFPGFIDIHMHIESSMMTPENFGKQAVLAGTTSVFVDPHEIGNVLGIKGISYMIENAKFSPVRQFNLASSCIPADAEFETSPHEVKWQQMKDMLDLEGIYGIAEVMDYPGVISDSKRMHDILNQGLIRNVMIQGHAPNVRGRSLSAYRLGGPMNNHTVRTAQDLIENLRTGMHVNLQASSLVNNNLQETIKGLQNHKWTDFVSLCTDDVHAKDLYEHGHINAIMQQLIQLGIDPITIIKWGTLNAAQEAGLEDIGAVAPGYVADLQLVQALDGSTPQAVFIGGELIASRGQLVQEKKTKPVATPKSILSNTVLLPKDLSLETFYLQVPHSDCQVAVVNCIDKARAELSLEWCTLPIKDNIVTVDPEENICFVAVLNRHGSDHKAVTLYRGLGLIKGAMASTISHDSHNLIVAYKKAEDALVAVKRLEELGGGICVSLNGKIEGELPLPIAGLMSELPCDLLVKEIDTMYPALKLIFEDKNPSLLKLSLLSLTVLPGMAITDKGLIDGTCRKPVKTFRERK